jgi:hypothetical protein
MIKGLREENFSEIHLSVEVVVKLLDHNTSTA